MLLLALSASAQREREPVPTRWRGPGELPRPAVCPRQAFSLREIETAGVPALFSHEPGRPATGRVAIVVATNVYAAVSNAVAGYARDLASNGFAAITATFSGTAEDLRAALSNWYGEAASLKGAVLVGDLPYAIWEMMKDFGDGVTNYAADLADIFFMDLDGTWADTNSAAPFSAGMYDTRGGNLYLEIWVSRLRGSGITAAAGAYTNEATVLTNYFHCLHRYRTTNMVMNKKGLTYTDNDWKDFREADQVEMQACYPTNVITRAVGIDPGAGGADFRDAYMTQNVEMIQLRCHGYAQAQTFDDGVSISFAVWTNKDPRAVFYNIYGCSAGNFLATNNIARIAILNRDANGLVSWSHSGEGGMIGFWDYETRVFFDAMGEGETVGEAFRRWYNDCVKADQFYYEEDWVTPRWWNGMILNGDGALTVRTPRYIHLAPDGGHVAPYSSWADAATNVHDAFGVASPGDILLVADGRYFPTNTLVFTSSKAITLRGTNEACGAVLDGSLSTNRGFDIQVLVNATIENLGICNFRGFGGTSGAGGRLRGGTVRNCIFTNNQVLGYGSGGGMEIGYACVVRDCAFIGNSVADSGGGGILIWTAGPVIDNCVFSNNVAEFGGGISMTESGMVVRCRIAGNRATGSVGGGGLYVVGNGSQIWNCEIEGNVSESRGGGVMMYRGWLCNSLVAGNIASNEGGGVYSQGYTNTDRLGSFLQNCTIAGNTSTGLGCGVYAVQYTYVVNSVVSSNGADDWFYAGWPDVIASHSCFGEAVAGASNLNAAPLFAGAGDYRLQAGSPCIDAGTGLYWHATVFDLDNRPRRAGAAVDMGAYEFQGAGVTDQDGDGMPDWWETLYGLNPTNAADAQEHADADGIDNLGEYVSDTCPTSGASFFCIREIAWTNAADVTFACSTARLYSLECGIGLSTGSWGEVGGQTHIAGPPAGILTLCDTNSRGAGCYRIRVRLP